MQAIDRSSLLDRTMHSLKEYIAGGEIMPGDKLPTEVQLCDMLGIGRSTVREAIRVLQAMGYLEIRRGKGTFLRSKEGLNTLTDAVTWFQQDETNIAETLEFRSYLEPYLARLAAKRITEEELEALGTIMDRYALAVREQDKDNLVINDGAFHRAVANATHNRTVIKAFEGLLLFLNEYFNNFITARSDITIYHQSHKKIYDALCAHDEKTAEDEMRAHINSAMDSLMKAAQSSPAE